MKNDKRWEGIRMMEDAREFLPFLDILKLIGGLYPLSTKVPTKTIS